MKRALLAALAGGVLLGCTAAAPLAPVAAPPALRAITLANAGFEDDNSRYDRCAPRWDCVSHADPKSHRFAMDTSAPASGKRSLCIERVTSEPWAVASQAVHDPKLSGARLRYSLAVRIDSAPEGAGPWIFVHRHKGDRHHEERLVKATRGWERMSLEFTVPEYAQIVEVGLTLMGPGRVCLDDARLEVLQEPKSPV